MIYFSMVGNLASITEPAGAAPADVTLTHAPFGRLTGFLDGPTSVAIESYGYDATGNRMSFENSSGLQAYGYPVDSHRLASVDGVGRTYDAAGNALTIGSAWTYTYGQAGRMATASDGTTLASYAYTGAGEQVRRTAAGSTTLFVYDEAGQLLGQYDGSGNPLQQYVWLDTLPVGVIAGGTIYHVQPDHLGTPRAVIDPLTDTAIWSWSILGEAFGTTIPNEDPDGDSVPFVFDLRFPGQRFDRFSGLNQNYFRDYEPLSGRYPSSDPIGLKAGWSTYGYAMGSPLLYLDPYGLWAWGDPLPNWLVDYSAGIGDTLSFGVTNVVREKMGINSAVNKCSSAYSMGEWSGVGLGAAFGGAHLGRNAILQGRKGFRRLAHDSRKWGSVRRTWSMAAGNGKPYLKANGQHLHHWLIPRRFTEVNAGFNYMPISAGFNSWMNGSTFTRSGVEWAFRGQVVGIYSSPVTATLNGCECN